MEQTIPRFCFRFMHFMQRIQLKKRRHCLIRNLHQNTKYKSLGPKSQCLKYISCFLEIFFCRQCVRLYFCSFTYNQAVPQHHNKSHMEEMLSNLSYIYKRECVTMLTVLSEAGIALLDCDDKLFLHQNKYTSIG